ncbi:unnamed protein product, partial [marine sediment metagenome]
MILATRSYANATPDTNLHGAPYAQRDHTMRGFR